MKRYALLSFLLLAAAGPLRAQAAPSSSAPTKHAQEAEVLAVVNKLWEAMRTRDSAMARTVFDTSARMFRVVERDSTRSIRVDRLDGFIRAIGGARDPWIERMVNPEVRVDQNIASVWTWYDFTVNGRQNHCGYDSIELARTSDGWKIVFLSDTRQPAPCQPPG
jgi:hypothetical protein